MFKKIFGGFSGVIAEKNSAGRAGQRSPLHQKRTVIHNDPHTPAQDSGGEISARAREIILEAKDGALRIKHEAEEEARRIRQEVLALGQRLQQKEESIDSKLSSLSAREQELTNNQHILTEKLSDLEKVKQEQLAKLERAAHLTRDEARTLILEQVEERLKDDIAKRIREKEEEARSLADKRAREILVEAMYQGATDYVPEYTTTTVRLPDEEMKGRIIGREGRNIRSLEMATGVDVDIDDTPGEIRLSSFDPVRREIAKRSLEKLIVDGRIQPARIEELVAKTKSDVEKIMHEEGERLCHTLGVYNLPAEVIDLLGRFKYRFSYGQNMIVHTLEETKIGVALAQEVGADVNVVRLGCLLHDIGKILTDDEGTHVEKGVALLKRYKFPQSVTDCVAQHHEDTPFTSLESQIVYIADAISGSRPGARHEPVEEYIKRLSDLENIAASFKEVEKAFALRAGREVRVLFKPKEADDNMMTILVQKIAEKIEKELKYPGVIRVIGIRESRAEAKAA